MEKMLTKAEEQVMQTLWKLGGGGLREITEAMPRPIPHSNTVATLLKILSEKGFVSVESIGRINRYSPKLSKAQYSERSMINLTKTYFDGSFNRMVSFMVEHQNVSLNDLELLIKQLKRKKP